MGISSIQRDWGIEPAIVRITTDDSLATIMADDYLSDQESNIRDLNNGDFEWNDNDLIAVSYSDGEGLFKRDSSNSRLKPLDGNFQATIAVTTAEFKGMYAAPKELLPAPGANRMYVVKKVALELDYNSAQYTGGGAVAVQYDDTVNGAGTDASEDIAAATINGYSADSIVGADGEIESAAASTIVNKGLYLSNETAAFADGDSPVYVHLEYSVVDTTV